MDAELRARFFAAGGGGLFPRVRADLERRLDCPVPFRLAETPLFFPEEVRDRFARAAGEILDRLSDPAWIAAHEEFVPERVRSAARGALPQLAQVDLAVVRDADGRLAPRLVELQGFPSLYAFQILLADVWATHLAGLAGIPDRWRLFFGGRTRAEATALLRGVLVGPHEPDEVILLDVDPAHQKTFPDFRVTQRWFGVDPLCVTELERDGDRLYRVKEGRRIAVRRIYQRIVLDELDSRDVGPRVRFREPLDVEWVPHPAWFFLWSKRSMPGLDHPCVPRTRLLSELDELPADLAARWVLKPLYSFAGGGVNVEPTAADVENVPAAQRSGWVLQERIDYCDALRTPDGHGVKAEIRLMFVRPEGGDRLELLLNLVRLSRGRMMGVDFNRDLDWTGSTVGIWPDA